MLGVLAGLTAGLAASALGGARRTDTAYDRLHDEAKGAHAIVFATQNDVFDADWGPILDAPEVEAAGTFALAPVRLTLPGDGGDAGFVLPPAGGLHVDTEVPVLSAGRLPDPDRVDEVWANELAAEAFGLEVGDTFTLTSYLDLAAFFGDVSDAEPGPSFTVTLTGIGKVPTDFTWLSEPQIFVTRAVLDDHPEIPRATNLVVRLRNGGDDLDRLRELVATEIDPDTPILDLIDAGSRVTTSTEVERDGLTLFGLAVAAAGLLIVGQAVVRSVQAAAADIPTLDALGMTRLEVTAALLVPLLPAAILSGIITVVVATLLSSRYPIGLSRQIEPDPGIQVAWFLVGGTALLTVVVVLSIAAVTAYGVARHRGLRPARHGLTRMERLLNAGSPPLPLAVGARFALVSGRGRTALPVRPAIVGAVTAVVGVVAAFTLGAGIDDALNDPSRVGTSWDAESYPNDDAVALSDDQQAAIDDDDAIAEYSIVGTLVARLAGTPTPLFAIDARRGAWTYQLLEGRAPRGEDEIVLGPDTLDRLALSLGDEVTAGPESQLRLRIVGTALLQQGVHWAYDQGGWLTSEGLESVEATGPEQQIRTTAYLRWTQAADVDAAIADLADAGLATDPPAIPQTVRHLGYVRSLPFLLAGFLVLLGVGAVGHSLISAVRRRRTELAVLRAMGMTPRQARAASAWQATWLAVVGALVGVPVGVVIGRALWRWIADATPIYYVPPLATLAVLLALPVALLAANALAALPGRAAARLQPARVLRAE